MKYLKKLLTLVTTIAMAFAMSVPAFASNTPSGHTILTVDEYVSFLQTESPEDVAKFKALTHEQQQQFINLLLDPNTYTMSSDKNITRSTDYNTQFSASQPSLTRATSWDAWGTSTVTLFGLEILEYRIEVGYNVSNGSITSINYNDAYIVKNLNPMVQTDTTSKNAYISGNKAYATGVFYYKLGPIEGLTVQIGNIHGELIAYPDGDTSISYWRD